MKIPTSRMMREWDKYTIQNKPISSVELMNQAANACVNALVENKLFLKHLQNNPLYVFCGHGNNGGDGLAICRLLSNHKIDCHAIVLEDSKQFSLDFIHQQKEINNQGKVSIHYVNQLSQLEIWNHSFVAIDAIFGIGLNKPLNGLAAAMVQRINLHSVYTISIDIPSGLLAEVYDEDYFHDLLAVEANQTLTFQVPKRSFLHASSYRFTGDFQVLDIGLLTSFQDSISDDQHWYDFQMAKIDFRPRTKFSHKGTYGHALCISGSYGKVGAAVLTAHAALKAGVGLLSIHAPKVAYTILQTAIPEAMVSSSDAMENIVDFPDLTAYSSIAIGPGIGTQLSTRAMVIRLLKECKVPLLLDADALNNISEELKKGTIIQFPEHSIITPHPKEFDRLVGHSANSFERLRKMQLFCKKYQIHAVLKGAHSAIVCPDESIYFNSSGNASLATAGSGDVLSGIIVALMAQGYSTLQAARLGVWAHGHAADRMYVKGKYTVLAKEISEELAYVWSDLIKNN